MVLSESAGEVIIEIDGDSSNFRNELNGLTRATGRAAGSLSDVFKGTIFGNLASTAVSMAFNAISNAINGTIEAGQNFESSMSQVAATMGITADKGNEAFSTLSEAAKQAGATTMFSASEAADALNYLALAGYDAATAADVLPTVLNLAAAGGMELAAASDLATDAMAALGIEATAENLQTFGDQMAITASKANTSVSQLGDAILTVGGTAKYLSGGTAELTAAVGVLANRGIKASEAGTHMRNLILSLSAPTDKAAKALKSLGVSAVDSNGDLRNLNDIFLDLTAAMDGMTSAEQTAVLSDIFNKTDLSSVQALMAGAGEEFQTLQAAAEDCDGAMQQMADTMMDNLAGDMKTLGSVTEALQISLYEALQPALRTGAQALTALVGAINGVVTGASPLAPVIRGVAAAIATLAAGYGIVQIKTLAVDVVPKLVSSFKALWAVFAANPIILVAAAIIGLGVAIASLYQTSEDFRNTMNSLFAGLGSALQPVIDAVKEIGAAFQTILSGDFSGGLQALGQAFAGFGNALASSLPDIATIILNGLAAAIPKVLSVAGEIVVNLVQGIATNLPQIIAAGAQVVVALVQGLIQTIPQIAASIPQILASIMQGIFSILPALGQAGVQIVQAIIGGIASAVSGILEALHLDGVVSGVSSVLSGLGSVAKTGFGALAEAASGVKEKVGAKLSGLGDSAAGAVSGLKDKLTSGLGAAASAASGATDKIVSGISTALSGAVSGAQGKAAQIGTAIATGLSGASGAAVSAVSSICSAIINTVGQIATQMTAKGTEAVTGFARAMQGGAGAAASAASAMASAASNSLNSFTSRAYTIGVNVGQGFVNGIRSKISAAQAAGAALGNAGSSALASAVKTASPSRVTYQIGVWVAEGFANGIEASTFVAENAADNLGNAVTGKIINFTDAVKKITEQAAKRQAEQEYKDYQRRLEEKYAKLATAEIDAKQDILDEIEQLQEDWNNKQLERQEKAAKEALQLQADALTKLQKEYSTAIDAITAKQERSAKSLADVSLLGTTARGNTRLTNLQDQINLITTYGEKMAALRQRGVSQSLWEEILGMDTKEAVDYVGKVLNLSEEAYSSYMEKWDEKEALAERVATDLYADEYYAAEKEFSDKLPEALADAGQEAMEALADSITDNAYPVIEATRNLIQSVQSELAGMSFESLLADAVFAEQGRLSDLLATTASTQETARQADRIAEAVQSASIRSRLGQGEKMIVLQVNGKEFARAIVDDLDAVQSQSPKVVNG